jgi:hypothetical protein
MRPRTNFGVIGLGVVGLGLMGFFVQPRPASARLGPSRLTRKAMVVTVRPSR